jgi:cobalt/nickel transport system ATP-binding protein
VGLVFQNSDAQLFSGTVEEELAFGPVHAGLGEREVERRVRDVAAMMGIGNLLDRAPYQLSGGEKKRVALGSALTMNPETLLLDEPTAGLDPRSRVWLAEMLGRLNRAGKTLVTATHDLDLIRGFATHALVLAEEGTVAAEGELEAVLEDRDLLRRVNLVHDHGHWHGEIYHTHLHSHGSGHEHTHETQDR